MNALLIYPEFPDTFWSFKHALKFLGKRAAQPPLGLMTVARAAAGRVEEAPGGHQRGAAARPRPGLGGRGSVERHAHPAQVAGGIVERCRARGLRTVVGGPIASSLPAAELKADHVVIGEAESLIAGLARDLEQGTAKPIYQAAERPEMRPARCPT